jgi:flagellar biosynthesis protein FlhB
MPENTGQERTEQATPKRKQEARKKGQVAQSKEISSVMIVMVSTAFFYFAGSWMFWNLSEFISGVYLNIDTLRFNDVADASAFSVETLYKLLTVLLPFLIPIAIAGFVSNVFQVGFQINTEAMVPKFSKLNPISGMKRFLSIKSLVELGKSIIKIIFIGSIVYLLVKIGRTRQVHHKNHIYWKHCLSTCKKRYDGISCPYPSRGGTDTGIYSPSITENLLFCLLGHVGFGRAGLHLSALAIRKGSEDDQAGG